MSLYRGAGAVSETYLISPHLALAEYLATQHRVWWDEQVESWAARPELAVSARRLGRSVFEPIRLMTGALHVTSGYRCGGLNADVGGRPTSRHVLGLAIDVIPLHMGPRAAMDAIVRAFDAGGLPDVDEAILELGWLHLQAAVDGVTPRRLALETSDGVHFRTFERAGTRHG